MLLFFAFSAFVYFINFPTFATSASAAVKELDEAAGRGDLVKVNKLLQVADPRETNSRSLLNAMHHKHYDVVKALLKDHRIDPTVNSNAVLILACNYGSLEIVEILLDGSLVNPAHNNNKALTTAVMSNKTDIVRKLLTTNVNPAACANRVLRLARGHDNDDIVEMLLKDPRVESFQDAYFYSKSKPNQTMKKVQALLNGMPIDLLLAASKGNLDYIKRFDLSTLTSRQLSIIESRIHATNQTYQKLFPIVTEAQEKLSLNANTAVDQETALKKNPVGSVESVEKMPASKSDSSATISAVSDDSIEATLGAETELADDFFSDWYMLDESGDYIHDEQAAFLSTLASYANPFSYSIIQKVFKAPV